MTPELNKIYTGDCLDVMSSWPENFVDTIITDPPYGIGFMGKGWDTFNPGFIKEASKRFDESPCKHVGNDTFTDPRMRKAIGSPAENAGSYDQSLSGHRHFQEWCCLWATEALRIAKPGAMMLVSGGTRTFHRMTAGLEDAGWQIRDCLMWLYGSGFPKSLDISKAIQKEFECRYLNSVNPAELPYRRFPVELNGGKTDFVAVNAVILHEGGPENPTGIGVEVGFNGQTGTLLFESTEHIDLNTISLWRKGLEDVLQKTNKYITLTTLETITGLKIWNLPRSPNTLRNILNFEGHGTALKPAWEPIILAMKALDGTFAENAEKWGVAGLNVDGGRIATIGADREKHLAEWDRVQSKAAETSVAMGAGLKNVRLNDYAKDGRWPANLLLDEEAAGMLDGVSEGKIHSAGHARPNDRRTDYEASGMFALHGAGGHRMGDSGGASRFFYVAKSGRAERNEGCDEITGGCSHPTVKPLDLMKYLCNLTRTPTGGIVLDPFAGSGTTLWAAEFHNRPWIGIEMNPEYVAIANARIARERGQIKMAI